MLVRTLLALFGFFHLLGGLYMLIAPHEWYASVPGVTATGTIGTWIIASISLRGGTPAPDRNHVGASGTATR